MVQRIQTTDWTEQREIYEQKISSAWNNLRQTEQAKELEQKVKETAEAAKGDAKEKAETAKAKSKEPRLLELK